MDDFFMIDALIVGSGIAAYYCMRSFEGKSLVISSSTINNSLISGKYFRTVGFGKKHLEDSMLEHGRGINEKSKVHMICSEIGAISSDPLLNPRFVEGGFFSDLGAVGRMNNECVRASIEKIIVIDGRVAGALISSEKKLEYIPCKSVILCSGGFAQRFGKTDSVGCKKGSALLAAMEAGAAVKDMEFVFMHPFVNNSVCFPTACLRGSVIFSSDLERARPIEAALAGDYSHKNLSSIAKMVHSLNGIYSSSLGPSLKLSPAAHSTLGGLVVDDNFMTCVGGLFAAGDCVAGIHGADRIGGTGLLTSAIAGKIAGRSASIYCKEKEAPVAPKRIVSEAKPAVGAKHPPDRSLPSPFDNFSLVNSKEGLAKGLRESLAENDLIAQAFFASAIRRKESRGCFFRSDFTEENPKMKKSFSFAVRNGKLRSL